MDIVSVDKVGRLFLPKGTRDRLGIDDSTNLLIAEIKEDALLLKKLDLDETKRQLSQDLEDVDLEELFSPLDP